jgi:DNA-binding transcriptional LysR family regulator
VLRLPSHLRGKGYNAPCNKLLDAAVTLTHLEATASFRSNDGEQLRAAVLAGLGITQAPHWLFAADIRAGIVRRILRDHERGKNYDQRRAACSPPPAQQSRRVC